MNVGILRVAGALDEVGLVRLPSIEGLLTLSEAQTALNAATLSTFVHQASADAQKEFAAVLEERRAAWVNADRSPGPCASPPCLPPCWPCCSRCMSPAASPCPSCAPSRWRKRWLAAT